MNKAFFLLVIFLTAGCQKYNSNSFDQKLLRTNRIDTSTPEGLRLSQAYQVLDKSCISCHTGYHNDWADLTTTQKWITKGLIEPGDAYISTLILRTKNMEGNMPKDNPEITEEDFQMIVEWIDNI